MKERRVPRPVKKIPARYMGNLPDYTRGEEIVNMITHIAGGVFAFVALLICCCLGAWHRNPAAIASGIIYGISMIIVFVVSGIYHGLTPERALKGKKVMQVIDHCDIYGLIVGTYAPVALTGLVRTNPKQAIISFSVVCVTCIVGTVFTAIDFKKFRIVSYASYFAAGWSVLMVSKLILATYPREFFVIIIVGGAVYTSGMFFFVPTWKRRYFHSIFHLFILGGAVIQFIAIAKYCL